MRAQNPLSARQPACEHRRVLGTVLFKYFVKEGFILFIDLQ